MLSGDQILAPSTTVIIRSNSNPIPSSSSKLSYSTPPSSVHQLSLSNLLANRGAVLRPFVLHLELCVLLGLESLDCLVPRNDGQSCLFIRCTGGDRITLSRILDATLLPDQFTRDPATRNQVFSKVLLVGTAEREFVEASGSLLHHSARLGHEDVCRYLLMCSCAAAHCPRAAEGASFRARSVTMPFNLRGRLIYWTFPPAPTPTAPPHPAL